MRRAVHEPAQDRARRRRAAGPRRAPRRATTRARRAGSPVGGTRASIVVPPGDAWAKKSRRGHVVACAPGGAAQAALGAHRPQVVRAALAVDEARSACAPSACVRCDGGRVARRARRRPPPGMGSGGDARAITPAARAPRPASSMAAHGGHAVESPATRDAVARACQRTGASIGNCAGLGPPSLCELVALLPAAAGRAYPGEVHARRTAASAPIETCSRASTRPSARPSTHGDGPAADPRRRRLGQDARADPPHRLPDPHRAARAPGEILAITFTNKAAQEMRERVELLLGHSHARDVGDDLPLRLRADAARRGAAAGLHAPVHDLRPGRLAPPGQALPRRARRRPQALHARRRPAPDLRREEQAARRRGLPPARRLATSSRRSPTSTSSTSASCTA